jgi:Tfp pilus assembly protein PilF
MREILDNRFRMRPKEGPEAAESSSAISSLVRRTAAILKTWWPLLLCCILALLFILIRWGFYFALLLNRSPRKRTVLLWAHIKRRLRLAGFKRGIGVAESEWAQDLNKHIEGIYLLYQGAAAARFAPEYTKQDYNNLFKTYRAFFRRRRLPGLLLILFTLSLIASPVQTQAQENSQENPADTLYENALDAEYAEYWDRAIDLYKEGRGQYPDDPRFPWALGNLYYSRSLYGLAWDEYRRTEELIPYEPEILFRLSRTAGYLNRDQVSVDYLEQLLAIDPENKDAISQLGWMYYKVHRLGDGERLLSAALEHFGEDSDLSMTLGTVYSDMYHYAEGKYWYKKAIELGEALGDRVFTAVAHYNLSILESRFYQFELALDETNASLDSLNRASGRLARGELYLRQLELARAQRDYESAYEIDTSPLAKINLAQVYQISGRLEEARLYAEDCLKNGDLSWMLNYGIDPDRYKRDIHEILYKTYKGLEQTEHFTPWSRTGEKFRSLFRRISYRYKSSAHRKLYQKYSLAAGDAYSADFFEDRNPHIDSAIQYYNAFETYPRRAMVYLKKARDFEVSIIPEAQASYDLEEGILKKNKNLIARAFAVLDPTWEREMIGKCYREFARMGRLFSSRSFSGAEQEAAEELFALNRGSLRQAGIRLQTAVYIDFKMQNSDNSVDFGGVNQESNMVNKKRSHAEKNLFRALNKAGFKITPPWDARYRLNISINGSETSGYTAACELGSAGGNVQTLRKIVSLRSLSKADIFDSVRALAEVVFRVE